MKNFSILFLVFSLFSQTKVIYTGKILDTKTFKLHENKILLIKDKRIVAIKDNYKASDKDQIIDLKNYTLLPGLMDCHTHLCWHINQRKNDGYVLSIVREPTAYRAIQGVMNARDMLMAGFTLVRDVGNAGNYADTALRMAIEDGLVPGPTIINAGRLISPFGGQRWVIPERKNYTQPEYFFADTKDEIKKAMRENVHFGAKLIKIVVDDQKYIYSEDDIRFIVNEAKLMNMKVAAHCATKQGAINAIKAGVATIEHGFSMDAETMKMAAKAKIYFVSTTFSLPVLKSIQSDLSNPAEKDYKSGVEVLRLAYQHGVKVAFGSDVIGKLEGHTRGEAALTFIKSFHDAGADNKQILEAMTINAAEAIGVEAERGNIRQGFFADLIAVKKNPVKDIHTLKDLVFVMKEGDIYLKN